MRTEFPPMPEAHQVARVDYLIPLLEKRDPNAEPWATLGDELASRTYKAKPFALRGGGSGEGGAI
jgi:hypothetical protein